jgi:UV DNA damage repair endonuclease
MMLFLSSEKTKRIYMYDIKNTVYTFYFIMYNKVTMYNVSSRLSLIAYIPADHDSRCAIFILKLNSLNFYLLM